MTENKINFLSDLSESIQKLAQDKGVSEEKIKSLIQQSFGRFYEQKLNRPVDLHFEFGTKLTIYRLYQVVEKVSDPEKEITTGDPRLKEGKIENNTFFLPLEVANFSFDWVAEFKRITEQSLKEIGWESQSKLLQKLQQEETLVRGNLQGQRGDYYLVNLAKENLNLSLEAEKVVWEKKEWTSSQQRPRLGQSLLFLIKQVSEKPIENQPSVLLTRTSDAFILQVLKREIPELKEGVIVVQQILRSPESVKIVVGSKVRGINLIGTFIGVEAARIKSVSRSLFPQRIDIVPWDKEKRASESRAKPLEAGGSYKNIQLRTSEERSEPKARSWNKKFNINK